MKNLYAAMFFMLMPALGLTAAPSENAAICKWLKHTSEIHIHRMRGAELNEIWHSADGHMEAVYGADKRLVENHFNAGSYNYYNAYSRPLKHFMFDILPWMVWGSAKNDPTSQDERVTAYIKDLRAGHAHAARNAADCGDMAMVDAEDKAALDFFARALKRSGMTVEKFTDEASFAPLKPALLEELKGAEGMLGQIDFQRAVAEAKAREKAAEAAKAKP